MKKKRRKGIGKGSEYEREICRILSKWVSNGKRDDIFWRSAGSGSREMHRRKKNLNTANQSGDIACLDTDVLAAKKLINKWFVELKSGYGSWDILRSLASFNTCPILLKFWNKLEKQAEEANKNPILIFRMPRSRSLIVLRASNYSCFDIAEVIQHSMRLKYMSNTELVIMSLRDFIFFFDPQDFFSENVGGSE